MADQPLSSHSESALLRDRVAWRICCFALKYIASERYCRMIDGAVRYGLMSAAWDSSRTKAEPWENEHARELSRKLGQFGGIPDDGIPPTAIGGIE